MTVRSRQSALARLVDWDLDAEEAAVEDRAEAEQAAEHRNGAGSPTAQT
jgi:hypothetical protein